MGAPAGRPQHVTAAQPLNQHRSLAARPLCSRAARTSIRRCRQIFVRDRVAYKDRYLPCGTSVCVCVCVCVMVAVVSRAYVVRGADYKCPDSIQLDTIGEVVVATCVAVCTVSQSPDVLLSTGRRYGRIPRHRACRCRGMRPIWHLGSVYGQSPPRACRHITLGRWAPAVAGPSSAWNSFPRLSPDV